LGAFEVLAYSTGRYMKKRGAPFKQDSDKIKSVRPGLRCHADKWKKATEKYPKQINRMFNNWLDEILSRK